MYRKIRRKIKTIGFRKSVQLIASRVYNTLFHSRNLLFRVDLLDLNLDKIPANEKVQVKQKLSFQELDQFERENLSSYGGGNFLETIKNRLARGHRLFLGYINGEVAGARWVLTGGDQVFFTIPLAKREFMCLAAFTIYKYRRMGVSTTIFKHVLLTMKSEGYVYGYVFTKEWNFHRKGILKVGFKFVGKFREIPLFRRKIVIWSSVIDQKL